MTTKDFQENAALRAGLPHVICCGPFRGPERRRHAWLMARGGMDVALIQTQELCHG